MRVWALLMLHRALALPGQRHHISAMPTLLILMAVGVAAFFIFTSARAAAERAAEIGRDACQAAGVQWLDQSVHATGMRLRRRDNGWLGVDRSSIIDMVAPAPIILPRGQT